MQARSPSLSSTLSAYVILFAFDVVGVYCTTFVIGAPLTEGWAWSLVFAVFAVLMNVTPRTMVGMYPLYNDDENDANDAPPRATNSESDDADDEDFCSLFFPFSSRELWNPLRHAVPLPKRLHTNTAFRVVFVVAAACGAIVSPLDAENWWQYWPTPSLVLCGVVTIGAVLIPERVYRRWAVASGGSRKSDVL